MTGENNYAYEIRFVDNNVVQVFDLAAKNTTSNAILPLEYSEDEVVKGQLRYSKLVGGNVSSTTDRDMFGYEDNNQPYEHKVMTKISKNRKSTQRNTFFMMGGGGNDHTRYDSGTDIEEDYQKNISTIQESSVIEDNQSYSEIQDSSSIIHKDNSYHIVAEPVLEPALMLAPTPTLAPTSISVPVPPLEPASMSVSVPTLESTSSISIPAPAPTTPKPASIKYNPVTNIPQQIFAPPHFDNETQYSIDNHDTSSEKYMQQSMTINSKKSKDCCCIIS